MRETMNRSDRIQIRIILIVMDILAIAGSFFGSLWLRYEFRFSEIPQEYIDGYISTIGIWIAINIITFSIFKLYRSIPSFAGTQDLFRNLLCHLFLGALGIVLVNIFKIDMPRSYYALGWFFTLVTTTIIHFGRRLVIGVRDHVTSAKIQKNATDRIMIIGAGIAGHTVMREFIESKKLTSRVMCFIDDNVAKKGCILEGVPIVGTRDDIIASVEKYDITKIIFAIPSCNGANKKEILNICSKTGCKVEIIPGIYQLVDGDVTVGKLRKVQIQDLLGRDPIRVNTEDIARYISGKTVLVTGGGGSIGSELCRQVAASNPELLIIFDIYENNAYDIQLELQRVHPELNLLALIGSVRNLARLESIMETYKPDIIFHAAAHKHVPLMEDSPNEAIKNNVFGTYKLARTAAKYGVKKFVLISTDKAVNPTNIMGASKRLCEMVVQMMNRKSKTTEFVAVRFGNVLGSNGSVIPLFEKQINEGGPITVTHPDITRFFMTIPEAVSLVLQAGYYANGGEIYVLDMGEPVKIADMAKNLIRLSGYQPDVDIKIEYIGLRPGEKLYEELLMDEEGLQDTENKLIHIGKPIEMDDDLFEKQLEQLAQACTSESDKIKEIVESIVPTYKRTK